MSSCRVTGVEGPAFVLAVDSAIIPGPMFGVVVRRWFSMRGAYDRDKKIPLGVPG